MCRSCGCHCRRRGRHSGRIGEGCGWSGHRRCLRYGRAGNIRRRARNGIGIIRDFAIQAFPALAVRQLRELRVAQRLEQGNLFLGQGRGGIAEQDEAEDEEALLTQVTQDIAEEFVEVNKTIIQ